MCSRGVVRPSPERVRLDSADVAELMSDDLTQSLIPPQSENRYREGWSVNPETQPPDTMPDGVGERALRVASMRRRITSSVGSDDERRHP
jgi:hypothetical protein